jgi:hypothetical protein
LAEPLWLSLPTSSTTSAIQGFPEKRDADDPRRISDYLATGGAPSAYRLHTILRIERYAGWSTPKILKNSRFTQENEGNKIFRFVIDI